MNHADVAILGKIGVFRLHHSVALTEQLVIEDCKVLCRTLGIDTFLQQLVESVHIQCTLVPIGAKKGYIGSTFDRIARW